MRKLLFHPDIAIDIKSSYVWYEEKIIGLGEKFLLELENGYIAIEKFPQSWATFHFGFKRYILNSFPFSIIYKINNNDIVIVAIMHNSRKPNFWKDRLK